MNTATTSSKKASTKTSKASKASTKKDKSPTGEKSEELTEAELEAKRLRETPQPIDTDPDNQVYLPGQEHIAIPEVDEAAKDYAKKRDLVLKHQKPRDDAEKVLVALMVKHNLPEYHHGRVHVTPKTDDVKFKVKVDDEKPKATTATTKSATKKRTSIEEDDF